MIACQLDKQQEATILEKTNQKRLGFGAFLFGGAACRGGGVLRACAQSAWVASQGPCRFRFSQRYPIRCGTTGGLVSGT